MSDPIERSGLSETQFNGKISGGVDWANTDTGLMQALDEMGQLLREIVGTHRELGAHAAAIAADMAEARQVIADEKATKVTNVGGQSGSALTRLQVKGQELAAERERLDSRDSTVKSGQDVFTGIGKTQGSEAAQQAISLIQKGIDILDQMRSIAARR